MKHLRLLLCLLLCSTPAMADDGLSHIVLLWLKQPGNTQHIQRIREISQTFAAIPGVRSVKTGTAVRSERVIVDDSFDIGIVLEFDDRQAMQRYLEHPQHQRAVHDVIRPLVRRVVVYDLD